MQGTYRPTSPLAYDRPKIVAHTDGTEVYCPGCVSTAKAISPDITLTPVFRGELFAHGHGNTCAICGETLI
jgi:hypothetical protein